MDSQGLSSEAAAKSGSPPEAGTKAPPAFLVRWGTLVFFIGLLCTTSAPIFMRLSEIGPVATGAWRMTLAVPFLMLLLKFERSDRAEKLDRKDFMLLCVAGLFFAADLALWNSSVVLTSVASASFLANSAPVFVVLGSWLLFREKIKPMFMFGLAVSILGSGIMMSESLDTSMRNFTGDFLSVAAAAFYAAYILTVARSRKRASTMMLMVVSSAACAVTLWIAALLLEPALWPQTARGWWVVIGTALLTQVAGQTLIALSLGYVSANFSALILLVQPVIPTIGAWLLFNESLSGWQVVGAVGIVVGLALARPSPSQAQS